MVDVLLATDFDQASDIAFDFCLSIATKVPMRIVVAHIYKPQTNEHLSRSQRELFRQNEMKRYESRLVRSSRLYPHASKPDIIHHTEVVIAIEEGGVSDGLQKLAAEYNCSVIVLGVKKNPGIMKRLFGQISQSLIFQSRPHVLLIPEVHDGSIAVQSALCLALNDEEGIQQRLGSTGLFPDVETVEFEVRDGREKWANALVKQGDLLAMGIEKSATDLTDRVGFIHWLYDHLDRPLILLR